MRSDENKTVGGISSQRYLVHIHRADDRVGDIRIGDIMIDCRFGCAVGTFIPKVLHTTTVSRCVN